MHNLPINGAQVRRTLRPALPLLGLALAALLAALWAGLIRLGWPWPALQPLLPGAHGPLMVSGFLGALIGLERAVALSGLGERRARLSYASPLLTGLGGLALLVGVPGRLGPLLITLGSLALTAVAIAIHRRHPALHAAVMALGAAAWLVGNGLWLLSGAAPPAVPWWIGFLVLTIAGERLEMSRMLQPSLLARRAFLLAVLVFLAGMALSVVAFGAGVRVAGAGLLLLALWLLRYDIARRTVRRTGLPRFIAVCLLAGYFWLAVGGLFSLRYGGVTAGLGYDAMLHAVFLGFVFSMIFGHAAVILPAVLGMATPYRPIFYGHLLLLHISLLLRVGGDVAGWLPGRRWGGLLNEVALILFLAVTALTVRQARRRQA